jgi:hypothetical protein
MSVADVKALVAFLEERDGGRPDKTQHISWLRGLTQEARERGWLGVDSRLALRSSAPVDLPTLMVKINGFTTVLEINDADVRLGDLPFDFLDNVWFRFRAGPVEINGLTDEDWVLMRLADTRGQIK